jgi:hypothetical protein
MASNSFLVMLLVISLGHSAIGVSKFSRVAVCLSGLSRFAEFTLPLIAANIVNPNNATVFFVTGGKSVEQLGRRSQTGPEISAKRALAILEAHGINPAAVVTFDDSDTGFKNEGDIGNRTASYSQKIEMCAELISRYAQYNPFHLVVRLRPDLVVLKPIIVGLKDGSISVDTGGGVSLVNSSRFIMTGWRALDLRL